MRQYAPAAFRATQFRAVTEEDYHQAALTISGVSGAVASFRWTGSWYTVFVGIDPTDPDNVLTSARGVTRLEPRFKQHVLDSLTRYRLAGYDLEIRSARYVPLDIAIQICAKRRLLPRRRRAARRSSVGAYRMAGFFDPANFTFGQPVYLSQIYAAVEAVEGVESATITVFHPHGRDPSGRAGERQHPDRGVGDRAARQRSQQHGERHAHHHRRRRIVSDDCGCCATQPVAAPGEIDNRAGLSAIAYRIGTFATFRKAIVDELSHTRQLAGLTRASATTTPSRRSSCGRPSPTCSPSTRSASPTRRSCARRRCAIRCCAWCG